MRGEYLRLIRKTRFLLELPPRARRIRMRVVLKTMGRGTTSACAENTPPRVTHHLLFRNYLRVRGEYSQPLLMASPMMELPPRARRIQLTSGFVVLAFGTTSACAENTKALVFLHPSDRNYLRVRGEYPRESCRLTSAWELPPRARRILPRLGRAFGIPGTTSACAENTCCNAWIAFNPRNYLRVRGEYNISNLIR